MTRGAIFSGDLIDSTRAGSQAVDRAMKSLAEAAREIGEWAGADTRFTRFRGDGWQLYLAETAMVLQAFLLLKAKLRSSGSGLATRLSIAIGTIDRLGTADLSDAAGPAFVESGRKLDQMPASSRLSFTSNAAESAWQRAVFDLAEWQSSRWTREQAEAVALALGPVSLSPTDSMAQQLGISRQAFEARRKGSGIAAMTAAFLAFAAGQAAEGRLHV